MTDFSQTSPQGEIPNNRRVLVIDDNVAIHDDVRKILTSSETEESELEKEAQMLFGTPTSQKLIEHEFEMDFAALGEIGVELVDRSVSQGRPFALAFVDVRMPGLDGVETTQRIWELDPNVQVVLCTAYSDYSLSDLLSRLGPTDRLLVLKKPYDPVELSLMAVAMTEKWNLAQAANKVIQRQSDSISKSQRLVQILRDCQEELEGERLALRDQADCLSVRIQQQAAELLCTREITCLALVQLAESRDPETGEHLLRMRAFSQIIAEQLSQQGPYVEQIDEQFLDDLWRSSPLHDIGKVGIPDDILLKPGRLTPEEFEVMKRHTIIGADALVTASIDNDYGGFLKMAVDIARHHHERVDGGGYPDGLVKEQTPLAARIVAVADAFDALTSQRVYKDAVAPSKARQIIEQDAGSHFDPAVVEAFCNRFSEVCAAQQEINAYDEEGERSQSTILDPNRLRAQGSKWIAYRHRPAAVRADSEVAAREDLQGSLT